MQSESEYATLFIYLIGEDIRMFLGEYNITYVIICLTALIAGCVFALYVVRFRTVRIYNWNGCRYRYLGRARVRRSGGGYQVRIGERMADLSYTTLYQLCPSRYFVQKNKYADILLCAGREKSLLHVDKCMRQSIYYR